MIKTNSPDSKNKFLIWKQILSAENKFGVQVSDAQNEFRMLRAYLKCRKEIFDVGNKFWMQVSAAQNKFRMLQTNFKCWKQIFDAAETMFDGENECRIF